MNSIHSLALTVPAVVPAAGGNFWTFLNDQIAQARGAAVAVSILGAIFLVIGTIIKTKSVVPSIVAALIGAGLIWLCAGGLETLSNMWGGTVKTAAAVVTLPDVV
ncbi:hypothetical protein SPF06_18975 [Sinomonas sp. JGH33]|uniref:Conjugal transfer protein TrbC n=1 Tax=Sinomonas terricola TaxID=3110330 RepID=A0ABU5TAT5_9MICC|nr:hypothetical protein [Sinomonas sp. JGH33]MEA5456811.1 hypothetical protein [Sinomonas sp. JGH33]